MTRRRVAFFALTVLAIVSLDQFTKALVRSAHELGESHPLISGLLWLTRVHNTGAAFGMFRGQQWFLIAVAVVVLGAIVWVSVRVRPESPVARLALAMVSAGALGNLIDRAVLGGVTDFIDLGWFPVFNVADISLDVGVALLVWWILFSPEHRHTGADDPAHIDAGVDNGDDGATVTSGEPER